MLSGAALLAMSCPRQQHDAIESQTLRQLHVQAEGVSLAEQLQRTQSNFLLCTLQYVQADAATRGRLLQVMSACCHARFLW